MKIKLSGLLLCSVVVMQLAGCATAVKKPSEPIKKIAVVSIAVMAADLTLSVRTVPIQKLLDSTSDYLVKVTETKLSRIMQVHKISGFIDNPDYRNAGVKVVAAKDDRDYMTPHVNGKPMVLFSDNDDDVTGGKLKPEVAKKLCADLNVDGVVLIYSEWSASHGHFAPQMWAYTANFATVWDSRGNLVFKKRVDVDGEDVLGAAGAIVVNPGTIKQWSTAYSKSLDVFAEDMKRLSM